MSFPHFRFCICCLRIRSRIIIVVVIILRSENRLDLLVSISTIREEGGVEKVIWTTSFYPRASEALRDQVGDLPCPQA